MCHWLTLAVCDPRALEPLRALDVQWTPVESPQLPGEARGPQGYRVTIGGCSCELFRPSNRDALVGALVECRTIAGELFAHRRFGDPPSGGGCVERSVVLEPEQFVDDDRLAGDRWVRLQPACTTDRAAPAKIDGADILAFHPARERGERGVVVRVVLEYPHTPGFTVADCDAQWRVVSTRWFATQAEADEAVAGSGPTGC